jgi:hypothetical protein
MGTHRFAKHQKKRQILALEYVGDLLVELLHGRRPF